jgi:hypothetical protein
LFALRIFAQQISFTRSRRKNYFRPINQAFDASDELYSPSWHWRCYWRLPLRTNPCDLTRPVPAGRHQNQIHEEN